MVAKVYAIAKKRFTTEALIAMRFRREGSQMVKRGAGRVELASATSLDGNWWRVRPAVRHWQR
jgi:hypothetical protein